MFIEVGKMVLEYVDELFVFSVELEVMIKYYFKGWLVEFCVGVLDVVLKLLVCCLL